VGAEQGRAVVPRRPAGVPLRGAELDRTLAALADPTRRAIVERIRDRPQRPSEVAEALSMSRPAMSRHLRVLRKAGLISQELLEDDARAKLIQLRTEPLSQLRTWVEEVEAMWGDQLQAFKAHAERVHRGARR
jgi:DNA-binding transcriptional ArsR family regulator